MPKTKKYRASKGSSHGSHEEKEPEKLKLNDDEKSQRKEDIQLFVDMSTERDKPHPELDEMSYLQYWESNRKKDLSHIPPKQNKQDVRINTGITREKITTLESTALDLNFVPNVTTFDSESILVAELGDNMGDMVKKSREIENYDKKRPIYYRELISQGDVFVLETFTEKFKDVPVEKLNWDPINNKLSDFSLKTRLKKVFAECESKRIDGRQVFLGSMRIEYIEDQDHVAILSKFSRKDAKSRYGQWERWENVPKKLGVFKDVEDGATYPSWNETKLTIQEDEVGELILFDKVKQRVQIYLNETPMLPVNYPLEAISPSGDIPMAQGKNEIIAGFAYSKSQPSKTKIEHEVFDEVTKLMIEGMRQGRKPPKGSRGKKLVSPNVFIAGKVTPDMKEGDIFDLIKNAGLNSSDFSFYQLIKEAIDDKSVNPSFSGEGRAGADPTATQVLQEKEQQLLKLGSLIDGIINFERRLTWLRIYNILENWTTEVDFSINPTREGIKAGFRRFSVDTILPDGKKGIKEFRIQTGEIPTLEEQQKEEKKLTEKNGVETRIVFLNPALLRKLKYIWIILIIPTPKSNDKLSQILFIENLRQAIELFGPESLNSEYLKQRYAILINEDYNKMFKKIDPLQLLQQGFQTNGKSNPAVGPAKSAAGARSQPIKAAVQ